MLPCSSRSRLLLLRPRIQLPTHHPSAPLRRVLSLRCALSHFLLQLASDLRTPVLFRCTTPAAGSGMDVAGLMPTLFLLKDALMQVGWHAGAAAAMAAAAGAFCAAAAAAAASVM